MFMLGALVIVPACVRRLGSGRPNAGVGGMGGWGGRKANFKYLFGESCFLEPKMPAAIYRLQ